jgi:hypothetical protein
VIVYRRDKVFAMDSPHARHASTPAEVLAAVERTLDNATFKLGRLRTRNRGSSVAKDLTSISYDVSAARHDIARLRDRLGGDVGPAD